MEESNGDELWQSGAMQKHAKALGGGIPSAAAALGCCSGLFSISGLPLILRCQKSLRRAWRRRVLLRRAELIDDEALDGPRREYHQGSRIRDRGWRPELSSTTAVPLRRAGSRRNE